jgi:hypothetical protein
MKNQTNGAGSRAAKTNITKVSFKPTATVEALLQKAEDIGLDRNTVINECLRRKQAELPGAVAPDSEARIADVWIKQLNANAKMMHGKKLTDLRPITITLDHDVATRVRALARRVARRTGVTLWQARAAITETAYQMMLPSVIELSAKETRS